MESIPATLGLGSGIDTRALVTQLVEAQFQLKNQTIDAKTEALTAQISAVTQLKSGMIGFSNALAQLVSGGTLTTQPVSGDPKIFTATALPGARLGGFSADLEVRALASAQVVTSAGVTDRNAPIGTGKLTLTFGAATFTGATLSGFAPDTDRTPVEITIGANDNSLAGIARAINAANAGVTASIVTDASGARLSIKGATGAESAFTLQATEDVGAPGLAAFNHSVATPTMTVSRFAGDAVVALDGLEVKRPTNSISDLIAGVRVDLVDADLGRTIPITSARPTTGIGQAVSDFVAAFNELRAILKTETDPLTGALRGDPGARDMARKLGSLTSTILAQPGTPGAPRTLAEIGIKTNRDGTLTLDVAQLNKQLAAHPDAVEALFNPSQSADSAQISITSAIGAAKAGSYKVENLVQALPGTQTGAARPAAFLSPVTLDATNNRFTIAINGGTAVEIAVAEGSYADGASLVAAIQAAAEADTTLAGRASFAWTADAFAARTTGTGASASIAFAAVDATLAAALGLDAVISTAGRTASATIAGKPAVVIGNRFIASSTSDASGLSFEASGDVALATITVELGLAKALEDVAERLTDSGAGLSASETRYQKEQARLAADQAKIDEQTEQVRERLTRQFAGMDARVAAYKATQSFLEQQVKVWTQDR